MWWSFLNNNSYYGFSDSTSQFTTLITTWAQRILGASALSSLFSGSPMFNTVALLVLGTLLEAGRRTGDWLMERFRIRFHISAEFRDGDPTYDWIFLFLTEKQIWRRSTDFVVTSKTSKRKWGILTSSEEGTPEQHAEYVPSYHLPTLFRWNGYWVETSGTDLSEPVSTGRYSDSGSRGVICLKIYTRNIKALTTLVEYARSRYNEVSSPHILVHTTDNPGYGTPMYWAEVTQKPRRPLKTIVLEGNVLEDLLADAKEFISMEEWYRDAGIPHRRGYLLYGPPGTGKTSTIYAMAGELGMGIYALSLASDFVDDTFLQKASAAVPKHSILLIEDIDCAFPSREEAEEDHWRQKSRVTLSGLLNVLDGVGSEEGKLFFATTNHMEKLDPALIRPGRVDVRIEYKLATRNQASALFARFYPKKHMASLKLSDLSEKSPSFDEGIELLARKFAEGIPEHEFSTAEIQGYLLNHKKEPEQAADGVNEWVEVQRKAREELRLKLEEEEKKKLARKKKKEEEDEDKDKDEEDEKKEKKEALVKEPNGQTVSSDTSESDVTKVNEQS
ncbi:mitochondrial chaperone BCS1 [Coprinopsis cinerea okayama7|uniref:Mitochondrial chaperone BCS1 n=1 Tax=Coprinopsis cinerea (strain Okayama-7 / 130 / ATCC MYA-4618 / FGSC 9003) TaxID=240176 RepID=A8NIT2_COPC7|nr:mitochondrial chaperone BCS1 [Coprinopsis cinerea okayama7\|eukprot:XP_001834066.2 mitochondrial chaperone BCS1 [Coprinopsis cinerea okayama7\